MEGSPTYQSSDALNAQPVKKNLLYLGLCGFFITHALLGELIGGKLIQIGPFAMSIGVIPWPFVFMTTDLINEYFGVEGVKKITWFTMGLIVYMFLLVWAAMAVPAAPFSPVQDAHFQTVFGQSLWIIVGSLVAFAFSQLIDATVFWALRKKTNGRLLWLRATGSTVISQFLDSIVIIGIAFWLPGKISTTDFFKVSLSNYAYKFVIALSLTPLIYLAHNLIDKWIKTPRQA